MANSPRPQISRKTTGANQTPAPAGTTPTNLPFGEADRRPPDRLERTATQLRDLLEAEHQALLGRDLDALNTLVGEKTALLTQLEAAFGDLAEGPSPLSGLDHDEPRAAESRILSPSLRAVLAQCHHLNQRNGSQLRARQAYVERMLALIHGAPPGTLTAHEHAKTYDRSGVAPSPGYRGNAARHYRA